MSRCCSKSELNKTLVTNLMLLRFKSLLQNSGGFVGGYNGITGEIKC